jgi:hypothetical protein
MNQVTEAVYRKAMGLGPDDPIALTPLYEPDQTEPADDEPDQASPDQIQLDKSEPDQGGPDQTEAPATATE